MDPATIAAVVSALATVIGTLATIAAAAAAIFPAVADRKRKAREQDKGSKQESDVEQPTLKKVPKLAVQEDGRFVGGTDAVRHVALTLLDESWDGDLIVHSAAIEAIETELQELESLSTLSAAQGDRIVNLRDYLSVGQAALARVEAALRSTFIPPPPPRERKWGTFMRLEDATIFIESLFACANLATRSEGDWTKCWVFIRESRIRYKYRRQVFLPKTEKQIASDNWDSELVDNPRLTRHLTTQSTNVLPVLAFYNEHNEPIARYLLPAIVLELVHNVTFEKTKSVAEFWNHLSELNLPEDDRDPLNPFDWCVALNPDASEEDFRAGFSIPPKSIADLRAHVNELKKRHGG